MNPFIDKLDLRVTLFALGMALSFLFMHQSDGKLSMPVLMWVVAGAVMPPLPISLLCLLVIVCWLRLWLVAFYARAQTGRVFFWSGFPLWLIVSALMASHSFKPFDTESLWFWLPTLVFTLCSLILVKLFYLRSTSSSLRKKWN